MLLAQINEIKEVFTETAGTFGLAVAILIALVIVLGVGIWFMVRAAVKFLKPLIEEFFTAHLLTMRCVRENIEKVSTNAEAQSDSIARMAAATTTQAEGQVKVLGTLEDLKAATEKTNAILKDNGKCQATQIQDLIKQLHPRAS